MPSVEAVLSRSSWLVEVALDQLGSAMDCLEGTAASGGTDPAQGGVETALNHLDELKETLLSVAEALREGRGTNKYGLNPSSSMAEMPFTPMSAARALASHIQAPGAHTPGPPSPPPDRIDLIERTESLTIVRDWLTGVQDGACGTEAPSPRPSPVVSGVRDRKRSTSSTATLEVAILSPPPTQRTPVTVPLGEPPGKSSRSPTSTCRSSPHSVHRRDFPSPMRPTDAQEAAHGSSMVSIPLPLDRGSIERCASSGPRLGALMETGDQPGSPSHPGPRLVRKLQEELNASPRLTFKRPPAPAQSRPSSTASPHGSPTRSRAGKGTPISVQFSAPCPWLSPHSSPTAGARHPDQPSRPPRGIEVPGLVLAPTMARTSQRIFASSGNT
jgi:hypothetical protein